MNESQFKKEIMRELRKAGALAIRVEAGMGGTPGIPDIYAGRHGAYCWLEAKVGCNLEVDLVDALNQYQAIMIPSMWRNNLRAFIACRTGEYIGVRTPVRQLIIEDVSTLINMMMGSMQ